MVKLFFIFQLCVVFCSAKMQRKQGFRASARNDPTNARNLQGQSVKFSFYNAQTDKILSEILPDTVVNIGSIPPGNLTIVASVIGPTPGSVKLSLTGANSIEQIEGGAPYSLCSNSGSNLFPCNKLKTGNYTMSAILYVGTQATGNVLFSTKVNFEFAVGAISPTVSQPTPSAPVANPVSAPLKSCTVPKVCTNRINFHIMNSNQI
jgi:hypothetical protein